jgi:hypothetical protein
MIDDEHSESRRVSPTPKSDLDYSMMTTDPAWGQSFIPMDLKKKLSEQYVESKTEVNVQRVALDMIDENVKDLLTKDFKVIEEDTLEYSTPLKHITIRIDRVTGDFISTITDKVMSREGYWEILGYYTRDLRLGNLDDGANPFKPNEVAYCEYHLNLAGDELNYYHADLPHGFHKAFFSHIRRVASKIEISHSKHGWFRKQGSTMTSEVAYKGVPPDPQASKYLGWAKDGAKG